MKNWQVKKDGKVLFEGSERECWMWLHKHVQVSVHWALRNDGYTIVMGEVSDEVRRGG